VANKTTTRDMLVSQLVSQLVSWSYNCYKTVNRHNMTTNHQLNRGNQPDNTSARTLYTSPRIFCPVLDSVPRPRHSW